MTDSTDCVFARLDETIDAISRKMPGSPREEIVLTRLHLHVQLQLASWFETTLKPFGLNESTWMALLLIYSRPDERLGPSDISAALSFSRTNATRVVDELEQHGLVRRQPSPQDRRKTELVLTPVGLELITRAMPVQRQRMREAWQDFSAEERALFEAMQRKLLARLAG